MNANTKIAYVIARDHTQFAQCNNALNRLGITQIVRVTAPDNLRGVKRRRYIGLPGWTKSFTTYEILLFKQLAQTGSHSLYTLTEAKFQRLIEEANQVFDVVRALKDSLDETKQGGDFPDP